MDAYTVLREHEAVNVNGRNGVFSIHKFRADDGNRYETTDQDIANTAVSLFGQPAHITFEVRQNGNYTNYRIQAIELAAGGEQPAPQAGFTPPAQAYGAPSAAPAFIPAQPPVRAPSLDAVIREARIMFQSFGNGAALEFWKRLPQEHQTYENWVGLSRRLVRTTFTAASEIAEIQLAVASMPTSPAPPAGGVVAAAPVQQQVLDQAAAPVTAPVAAPPVAVAPIPQVPASAPAGPSDEIPF